MLAPEHQAVAHRLGLFWFRPSQVSVLGKNEEDEVLVDSFVFAWSYLQVSPTSQSANGACLFVAKVMVMVVVVVVVVKFGGDVGFRGLLGRVVIDRSQNGWGLVAVRDPPNSNQRPPCTLSCARVRTGLTYPGFFPPFC